MCVFHLFQDHSDTFSNQWPLCIFSMGGAQHINPLSTPRLRPWFPNSKWNMHRHAARHNPFLLDFFPCFTTFARSRLSHRDSTGFKLTVAMRSFAFHSILISFIYLCIWTDSEINLSATPFWQLLLGQAVYLCNRKGRIPLLDKCPMNQLGETNPITEGGLLSCAIKNLLKISAKEACMIHWSSGWRTFCWAVK